MIRLMQRNIFKLFLGSSLVALSISSCTKDLDRLPTNDVTSVQVYGSQEGTMEALSKVYGAWALTEGDVAGMDDGSTGFVRAFWNLQELPTDEAIVSWQDPGVPDFHSLSWSPSNGFIQGLYYRSLAQIKFANEFIKNLPAAKVSDDLRRQMKAEARFVRAFQYWVLLDCFGNPPFITEETPTGKVFPQQIKRADLFSYIEKELKELANDLPTARGGEYGRANQGAAWALLARLYLNSEVYTGTAHYNEAKEYATKVINAGYSLLPKYEWLFMADNDVANTETILSINFDGKRSQSWSGTTFLINAAMNGEVNDNLRRSGIEMGINGGWGGNRATATFASYFPDNEDSRKLILPQTETINEVATYMDGTHVYKFRNVKRDGTLGSDQTHPDTDFPLFRLAEMHLIVAEAALRLGDEATALREVNKLRVRAYGNDQHNLSSLSLEELLQERARELYWEGHRRTDLIRFGKLTSADMLWDWKGGEKAGRGVSSHYRLYPIPSSDLIANPENLKQNEGY